MKKCLYIIALTLAVIVPILMFSMPETGALLDRVFLQEERYPIYYRYLSPEKADRFYIQDGESYNSSNLVVNNIGENTYSGVQIHINPDGSIYIEGVAEKKVYIHITPAGWTMESGTYTLCDRLGVGQGDDDPGCYIYYEGFYEDGTHKALASTENAGDISFELDRTEFQSVDICLYVSEGEHAGATIFPGLYRGTEAESFSGAAMTYKVEGTTPIQLFYISRSEYEAIPESEKRIFLRNLKYDYMDSYLWTGVVFEDGSSIHFNYQGNHTVTEDTGNTYAWRIDRTN